MNDMRDILAQAQLFTWVDVDNRFKDIAKRGNWPDWLLEVDAYWDAVEFSVLIGTAPAELWDWLQVNLGPLSIDRAREVLLLESVGQPDRFIPVSINAVAEVAEVERKPRWNERRVVRSIATELPPPGRELPGGVQICAFHSFKGGVGRTLHCVALAHQLAGRRDATGGRMHKVLLVDADLEAPGISWMISAQGGRIEFSVEDFFALLHGEAEDGKSDVIQLARRYLVNQEYDGVVVLPARRELTRIEPSLIDPADLLTPGRSPYFVSEALAELALSVGADAVLVDLRAGSSELSAPILLDSRVQRVFVTTISDQSVRGTKSLIDELGRRAPSRSAADPVCRVLITQFQEKEHGAELAFAAAGLAEAVMASVQVDSGGAGQGEGFHDVVDRDLASQSLLSPFDPQLLALPGTWDEVRDIIGATRVGHDLAPLAESIFPEGEVNEPAAGQVGLGPERERLRAVAKSLVYAESAEADNDLLPTGALVSLISTHRTEAPVEVVVGAKGSGKTFTYLRMCMRGTWSEFARLAEVAGVELDAPLVPVLGSQYLSEPLRERVEQVQVRSAAALGGGSPARFLAVRDLVTESLGSDLNDVEWRKVWLACLARAAGCDVAPAEAEGRLAEMARTSRAIFVIDGLEDLFQQFSVDQKQQQALRVLLTACPEWLRALRGRPLGLVVFVRRDLVINAIRQNSDQFLSRYQASELRWNRTEALRLVAWVCERANAIEQFDVPVPLATSSRLSEVLVRLWGQKLGSNSSREARSEEWFLAALSDFNQQIQARDIVSFLAEAARIAVDEKFAARWGDRLLPPSAMRRALPECSRDKIGALGQENPPVGDLLTRLSGLVPELRKVPFALESVGLSASEARLLEANGVLFREEGQYWIPEIYRHGLDFGVTGTGRPRVLAVAKLVRRRGDK